MTSLHPQTYERRLFERLNDISHARTELYGVIGNKTSCSFLSGTHSSHTLYGSEIPVLVDSEAFQVVKSLKITRENDVVAEKVCLPYCV
jgi:hypothetical protein